MFMANTSDNIYAVPLHLFFTAAGEDAAAAGEDAAGVEVQKPAVEPQVQKPAGPAPGIFGFGASNKSTPVAGENDGGDQANQAPAATDSVADTPATERNSALQGRDPKRSPAAEKLNGFGGLGEGNSALQGRDPKRSVDPSKPVWLKRNTKPKDPTLGENEKDDEEDEEEFSNLQSTSSITGATDPTFLFFSEDLFSAKQIAYYGAVKNPVVEMYKMFTTTHQITVDDMYCNGNMNKNKFREFFILLFAQMFKVFSSKEYASNPKDFYSPLIPGYISHIGAEWLPSLNSFSVYIDEDKNGLQLNLQLANDTRLTFYVLEHTPKFIMKEHDKTKSGHCLHVTFKLHTSKHASQLGELERLIIGICNDQKKWLDDLNEQDKKSDLNFADSAKQLDLARYLELQTAGAKDFNPRVYEMEMDLNADFGFWANIAKHMYSRHKMCNWKGMYEEQHEDNHKHEFTHLVKALGKYVFKVQFRDGAGIHYKLPQRSSSASLSFHHTHGTKKTHKPTYTDPHTWTLTIDDQCSKIIYKGQQLPDNTKRKNLKSSQNKDQQSHSSCV